MNYFKLFATLVKAMVKSLSTRQYVLTFEKESDNLWHYCPIKKGNSIFETVEL